MRNQLYKYREYAFPLFSSLIFFVFRFPSLFEPDWYGDEGIYQVVAMGINHGRLLYRDIWDNKPPLLYVLYALLSSDQFTVRLASLVFGIVSVFVFFFLAKKLLKKQMVVNIATLLYSFLFGIPLLEGNIANAENFMLLPILSCALLLWKCLEREKYRGLILAGFLLSVAFLFKVVAVFDFAAFFLFLGFELLKKKTQLTTIISRLFSFTASFGAPIVLVALYFLLNGAFSDFLKAFITQNVGYVGYGNQLFIPQGLLFAKLMLLAGFCLFLFIKRKTFSRESIFILLWIAFAIFNAFFSQRPYTHYVLVLLPSFVLCFGLLLQNINNKTKTYYQYAGIALFVILAILVGKSFNFYQKTLAYYPNFFSFLSGSKNSTEYQAFFDVNTPIDYKLASYINTHAVETDTLFLWGDDPQVYTLTNKLPPGRFTALYHMTATKATLAETGDVFIKSKPTFVIINTKNVAFPFSLTEYQQKLTIASATIYERVH